MLDLMDNDDVAVRVFLTDGGTRSGTDGGGVDIGVVRFGAWRVTPVPSPRFSSPAFLIRVAFDLELAPGVPGPQWAEVGIEFTGGDMCVVDAVPRSIARTHESRSYVLTSGLQFVDRAGAGVQPSQEVSIDGLEPVIKVFGIGRQALRWRHIATSAEGVPAGSHTGWLVLETPPDTARLEVRFTATYELPAAASMGMSCGNTPVTRTVSLPRPEQPGRRAADADSDRTRRVFLVHGRDDEFAGRMREMLSLVGLRVMEWESIVAASGRGPAPVLSDIVFDGLHRAQAIVVLLTPDDVVWLHPDLRLPQEDSHEVTVLCQPRPNVLMELGAALLAFREHTVVVKAGDIRPMADLGGINYVAFDGSETARRKLIDRLRVAGCDLDDSGSEWTRDSRFQGIGTFTRRVPDSITVV